MARETECPLGLLTIAIEEDDLETVRNLINQGVNVTLLDEWILISAIRNGNLEMVKLLIEKGIDFHMEQDFPLCSATELGNKKIVDYLLSLGSDISCHDYGPFRLAAKAGKVEMTKFFLDKGTDPKMNFHSPICTAVLLRNESIVKLLSSFYSEGIPSDCYDRLITNNSTSNDRISEGTIEYVKQFQANPLIISQLMRQIFWKPTYYLYYLLYCYQEGLVTATVGRIRRFFSITTRLHDDLRQLMINRVFQQLNVVETVKNVKVARDVKGMKNILPNIEENVAVFLNNQSTFLSLFPS